jgi:hypothetical protein
METRGKRKQTIQTQKRGKKAKVKKVKQPQPTEKEEEDFEEKHAYKALAEKFNARWKDEWFLEENIDSALSGVIDNRLPKESYNRLCRHMDLLLDDHYPAGKQEELEKLKLVRAYDRMNSLLATADDMRDQMRNFLKQIRLLHDALANDYPF